MNQPKYGPKNQPLASLRKVDQETFSDRVKETLLAINADAVNGKLKEAPVTHEIFRVRCGDEELNDAMEEGSGGLDRLSCSSIGDLLVARLKMQGYVLYFDEKVLRTNLNTAKARLSGILPPE